MPYVYDKKCILLLGVIFPLIDGCIFPIIGFLMSRIIAAELKYTLDPPYYRDLVHTYCFITLGVAIFSGFSNSISLFLYSLLGEHTIKQIRLEVITKIFNMPVSWFHKEAHQPEKLTTTMTQHCKNLYNFLKSFTPHLLFIFSSIIASMIAALVF
jgi:ABC-type multidrug transport system fused ATPase/permease subunit